MTKPALRFVLLGFFVAALSITLTPNIGEAPTLAVAQSTEVFTQVLPAKVYSGVPSHPGDADADPTLGLNGYCVDVAGEGPVSIGANLGFAVTNGSVIDTDFFANGSATTTDDVYCVIVSAERITDELPRPDMIVHWNYIDGGATAQATLAIEVVTVTLDGTNGFTGIPGTVCTVGWDPLFLTGFTSNNPPSVPVSTNVVVALDFNAVPSSPPAILTPYHADSGPEWCVNLDSATPIASVSVTLSFWAVYDLRITTDDVLRQEQTTISIVQINRPELRHITPSGGGQVLNRRAATPNLVGGEHIACAVPSTASDTLSMSDIAISSPDGANITNLQVFDSPASLTGVPLNTKCFRWTSTAPGSQQVTATIGVSPANLLYPQLPCQPGCQPIHPVQIGWDTNGDGNGVDDPGGGLVKYWTNIERTIITPSGADWRNEDTHITNSTIEIPVAFNVKDGTLDAFIPLTEWVIGGRPGVESEPIDGVPVRLEITSACGYFQDPDLPPNTSPDISRKLIETTTSAGRVDFVIDILNDVNCGAASVIQLRITASYPPGIANPPAVEVETLTIRLSFQTSEPSPIVAWAGTVVTLNYGFGGEDCEEQPVVWLRESGAGTFLADGLEDDPDMARSTLVDCESIIQFGSEVPGEVVIEAQLIGNGRSKVIFPIFFLAFEDLTLGVDGSEPSVSELTGLSVNVRGWFVGDDPSGRPAEVKPDGRAVPADRWVLPDDWATLRGPDDLRPGWPSSPNLPPTPVTFFMENEGVANSYKGGVKNGAAGYFVISPSTFDNNISPVTRVPSVLGTPDRPRIISTLTDGGGSATLEVFGDYNLSFEGCVKNAPTGNPHCEVDDIAGRATYYAIVDYPQSQLEHRAKFPPVRSNTGTKVFHWEGYKRVTWEPGPTPNIRFVVVHMKDRDGFCDAINYHNTLGVKVQFAIDTRDGIITTAADRPFVVNNEGTRKFATVTTYDTMDDAGSPMNAALVKVVQSEDECQAWIRIDNSLGNPVDVHVTFSAPPAPVPGKLRISDINCVAPFDFVEITNIGDNEVSLAGFGLRSLRRTSSGVGGTFVEEEHLGLEGHLKPGERILVPGEAILRPWVNAAGEHVFVGESDYARIVWEEQTVAFRSCSGAPEEFSDLKFPADGEGSIELDIIVPFADRDTLQMSTGWNLVAIGGGGISVDEAISSDPDAVAAIYTYDDESESWLKFIPGLPDQAITLTDLEAGRAYWVLAKRPFTLLVPR